MKLPYVTFLDTTPVIINISRENDINGQTIIETVFTGKCRFSEKTITKIDTDGKLIQLKGKLYIDADIAVNLGVLGGNVRINNTEYKINAVKRLRNPDGSVNHTELELI